MNRNGVTFANAIVDISMSIAQIFPLANVKGRKAIVSQVGTNGETSYSTHCNGVEFTAANWDKRLGNDDYKCLPLQLRNSSVSRKLMVSLRSSLLSTKTGNKIEIKREEYRKYHKRPTMDLPKMT